MARSQDMPIVMLVTGQGCGHCERLKSEFLSDPTIQSFLGQRALVRVYNDAMNYRDLLTGRLDQAQLALEARDDGSATAIIVTTTH